MEEADHPDQLVAWMKEHGFLNEIEAGSVPATMETQNTLSYCWRSAMRDPNDVQVVALNVLSEGVAFDFYSAVIPVLNRLKILITAMVRSMLLRRHLMQVVLPTGGDAPSPATLASCLEDH
jgi:hypothetical protein